MKKLPYPLLMCLLMASCDSPSGEDTAPAPPAQTAAATYPSIPLDTLEYLWNNATYSDMTFYELPISTNQSELDQIRASLSYVAAAAPTIDPNCRPIGRVWFQVNGRNAEEADVYFSQGCTYYIWFEDGKPTYANEMTAEGVQFFNDIIASLPPDLQN